MPSPPSYGCCTRVNFVLKKHLLFQMNLSNSGLKNRSIKEYWLIFTVLKFPLGLQFSHNLTKFKIIKYISTIYIMTTTCTYLQQLTQVSDVAHGPLVSCYACLVMPPSQGTKPQFITSVRVVCFNRFACLIRGTSPPTFSDTTITDCHSDATFSARSTVTLIGSWSFECITILLIFI